MVYNLIHTVFVMQLPWHWECRGDGGCAGGRERSQREGPVVAEGGGVDLAQRLLLPLPTHQLWIQDPPWKVCPGLPAGTGILSAAQHADCALISQDAGLLLGAWKIGDTQWTTTAREADDCVQMYFPFHQHSSQTPGSWERTSRLCSPLISTCHCSAETSRKGFWMPNLDNEHQMLMFIFKYWHTTYAIKHTVWVFGFHCECPRDQKQKWEGKQRNRAMELARSVQCFCKKYLRTSGHCSWFKIMSWLQKLGNTHGSFTIAAPRWWEPGWLIFHIFYNEDVLLYDQGENV